jgi:hypothetical protein
MFIAAASRLALRVAITVVSLVALGVAWALLKQHRVGHSIEMIFVTGATILAIFSLGSFLTAWGTTTGIRQYSSGAFDVSRTGPDAKRRDREVQLSRGLTLVVLALVLIVLAMVLHPFV